MIPEYAIREWNKTVSWLRNEQIEQDLIISRSLVALFKDEYLSKHLAFRGGTALHKLYLKPPLRYSEDIDLVQINTEPIKETMDRIREALSFLGEAKITQKTHNNTLIFRFDSEILPIIPVRLKVEINTREHFNVFEFTQYDFNVNNQWYSGSCNITTYRIEELLGTKIRALYQRRKGRDLYDLYKALSIQNLNIDDIIHCYKKYIGFAIENPPTQKEYLLNMELKMQNDEFVNDTNLLLRPDDKYNIYDAWKLVRSQLIERL